MGSTILTLVGSYIIGEGGLADRALEDLDGDGWPELVLFDLSHHCLDVCCACSILPAVVLSWDGHHFVWATKLMRRAVPQDAWFRLYVAGVKQKHGSLQRWGFYTVWGQALALVYGGQAKAARHLLSVAYPGLRTQPYGHLWQRMQRHLRSSPYYKSLVTMNGGQI